MKLGLEVTLNIEIGTSTRQWLESLLCPKNPIIDKPGSIMYIVKANNPDVGYQIQPPTATDSEGNVVSSDLLTYEIASDNPNAVDIVPDEDGNQLTGVVHFGGPAGDGTPSTANVNVTVFAAGVVVGSFGAQFTVTAGDPSAITGGSIGFDGLTDQ